jgi:undecaprenyl-diphosphatase
MREPATIFGRHGWTVWAVVGLLAAAACFFFLDAWAVVGLRGVPDETRRLFRPLSDLGRAEWIVALSVAVGVFYWLAQRGTPDIRRDAAYRLGAQSAAYILAAVAAGGLSATLLKYMIGRARPRGFDTFGPESFTPFAFDSAHASLPSGHSATIFALATALAFLKPGLKWVFYGAAALIASARIMVGAHYPADVVAGALVGTVVVYGLTRLLAARKWLFRYDSGRRAILRGSRLRDAV